MELTETVPVAVAAEQVNLADWIFGLTDDEYRAVAPGSHHAMGIIGGAQRLGIINVEQIAGTLIVQHYRTKAAEADHVHLVSDRSEGFLLHTVPFTMKVWWDMAIQPAARGNGAELNCRIGFDAPGWVTAAGTLVRNDHQLHQHLIEETGGFARDIERKYG